MDSSGAYRRVCVCVCICERPVEGANPDRAPPPPPPPAVVAHPFFVMSKLALQMPWTLFPFTNARSIVINGSGVSANFPFFLYIYICWSARQVFCSEEFQHGAAALEKSIFSEVF